MLLQSLDISGFRCFDQLRGIPFHRLTVFIGENDSGKTAIVDALELLLSGKSPSADDFRLTGEERARAETISLRGIFSIEPNDTIPGNFRVPAGDQLILGKTFSASGTSCDVEALGFVDPRWSSFARQTAPIQRDLLASINLVPAANEEQRIEQFAQAVDAGTVPKQPARVEIRFSEIAEHLPRFERVASTDYRDPDAMVQRTFQAVVDAFIRPEEPESHERRLIPALAEIRDGITAALKAKVDDMLAALKKVHPGLVSVEASPTIDFSRSVTNVSLVIDTGDGARLVRTYGEGTKKKLWMGLLDWERQARAGLEHFSTLRAYDEPDVNLDYSAERKLFATILDDTSSADTRFQAVVCTHAVTLVDRAPGQAINLIKVNPDGTRTIEHLAAGGDEELLSFLSTVGRTVGLTNSALFYERSFLLVEGESEENALPVLYSNLYGKPMISDGIVLVNLHSCGAWRAILALMLRHRSHIVTLLLDRDVQRPDRPSRVTPEALRAIGFPDVFLAQNCIFVGTKELEDAFSSADIVIVLNTRWPRQDAAPWTTVHIDALRVPEYDFADDLIKLVRQNCQPALRQSVRKPEFALRMAEHCNSPETIPLAIRSALQLARAKAGIGEA
jgi:energy-coupling factor transporter ATP-binding protein EcfA2